MFLDAHKNDFCAPIPVNPCCSVYYTIFNQQIMFIENESVMTDLHRVSYAITSVINK